MALITRAALAAFLARLAYAPGSSAADDAIDSLGAFTLGTWQRVDSSAVAIANPSNTTENALVTTSIKANTMGAKGQIRATLLFSNNNNANSKIVRVKLGGTQLGIFTQTTSLSGQGTAFIRNRDVANLQVGYSGASFASSTLVVPTGAIDTTVDQNLTITGQLVSTSDTLTLEAWLVEVMRAT